VGHFFNVPPPPSLPPFRRPAQIIQVDDDKNELVGRGMFDHPYPTTKIMWAPEALAGQSGSKDLLATTGDYLRLWNVAGDHDIRFEAVFNNVRARAGAGEDGGER
jgi:DDB1- and CUL4-associated factor 7